jgi:hypothetical protein
VGSNPNLSYGQVLTPGQWNALFVGKQDDLGFTPVNKAGDVMLGELTTSIPTAGQAGFNLPPGISPSTPLNGDLWTTSAGIFARINGVTYQLSGLAFLSFVAPAVNFNAANADTTIPILLPPGFARFRVDKVLISGASGTLTTATFGVFTAAGGGGAAVVTAGTACTVSTGAEGTLNNLQSATINNALTESYAIATTPSLFFRIGTPQGSVATGNVTITIAPVS